MSINGQSQQIGRFYSKNLMSSSKQQDRRRKQRLFFETLEERRVMAANPLPIDLNLVPTDSNPQEFAEVNGVLYFQATTTDSGAELWRSDGTTAGTWQVKDIEPSPAAGSNPRNLVNVNGTLFFVARDPQTGSQELWKSDGTSAGTVLVDGQLGSSNVSELVEMGGSLYFVGFRQINTSGNELWKSDGTAAGTVIVRDIVRGYVGSYPNQLLNVNGTLYFTASTPTSGRELWKSNGTTAGTVQVREIAAVTDSSYPSKLTNVNGTLFFTANNVTNGVELWKSDGSVGGTVIVRDIAGGGASSSPSDLTAVGSTLFFTSGAELWKSNGTLAGTVQVENVPGGSSSPSRLTNVGGVLYFAAFGESLGNELWKSNGTAAGTVRVANINSVGYSSDPQDLRNIGGTLFFSAVQSEATGRELFKSDGTVSGTVLVKDIFPGVVNSYPRLIMPFNGRAFFAATNGINGYELWSSDGTDAGTTLVKDINATTASSDPTASAVVGSTLYFAADSGDGVTGRELWKTDGTLAGTTLVKDINPGPGGSYIGDMTNLGGVLYFTAFDANGYELWKSDGTATGTVMVRNIAAGGSSSRPRDLTVVGSTLYFTAIDTNANGRELWKSNGTAAGTVLVRNINATANYSSEPQELTAVGSTLFFTADNGVIGRELWKSDGTSAGTVFVRDVRANSTYSSYPSNLTAVNSTLFFTADDGTNGREVWRSNGSLAGTVILRNIISGASTSSPAELTNVNGTLYFSARETPSGRPELFKSDGTGAGTVAVEGSESLLNYPTKLVNVNGTLYFVATDELGSSGTELWKSNGTVATTTLVKDISPGPVDSVISQLTNVNGSLAFTVDLPDTGRELWKSDGSASATLPIIDLLPGPVTSNPTLLTDFNGKLAFTANNGPSGRELFVLSPNQAPVNTLPVGPIAAIEEAIAAITGISVADPDSGSEAVDFTLSVTSGTLNINTAVASGVVAANVTNNGTAVVKLRAPLQAINTTLASLSGVTYLANSNFFGNDVLTVVSNDLGNVGFGAPLSTTSSVTIAVAAVNDAPVLTVAAGPITYNENAAEILLDGLATVTDVDSADFDTGSVTVSPGATDSNDRLSVRNEGVGPGQIGVAGTNITFGGTTIGSITSGTSGGTLAISLNASATLAATQALLRNITFAVLGDNPATAPRSIVVTVNDGDGSNSLPSTVTVNLVASNDPPVITLPGATPTYLEDSAPILLDTTATVSDLDANLAGGNLTATITSNASPTDQLEIVSQGFLAGQIGVSESFVLFGTVSGPVVIGTFSSGTGSTPLVVSLNGNATVAAVQALLRSIAFRTLGDTPSTAVRGVAVQLTDGASGTSGVVAKSINVTAVNDAPVLSLLGPDIAYTENAAALIVSNTVTVTDVDSLDFSTGVLTVSLTANGSATDVLGIRNEGTAAGQISTSGATVSFGNVPIGSFVGGTGSALVVTLNANATSAAVQALGRNITYRSTSENPSTNSRTVQMLLTDGDGGTSIAVTKAIAVTRVNDRPVVGGIAGTIGYVENAASLILAPAATLTDVDSTDFGTGRLTVRFTTGGTISDRLEVRNVGFAAGQIGLAGTSVLFGGQNIGSFGGGVGTTSLIVNLNANATVTATLALIKSIGFFNVSDNPSTTPRTVEFTLDDGDGGTSTSVARTRTINVTAINDAPVITLASPVQTYTQSGAAVDIDAAAGVTDPDSANFAGGVFTITLTNNASASDLLEIRNEGVAAGQIGVSGNTVTFGGTVIGTFSGGAGLTALSINLNTAATPAAVQALARRITFRVTGVGISTLQRTVSFQLTDGDGGTSATVSKNINVSL